MAKFESEVKELQKRMDKLGIYERVLEKLEYDLKWDCMIYHNADEEHDSTWYTEPTEDDYSYDKFVVYKEVISEIEKMAHALTKR